MVRFVTFTNGSTRKLQLNPKHLVHKIKRDIIISPCIKSEFFTQGEHVWPYQHKGNELGHTKPSHLQGSTTSSKVNHLYQEDTSDHTRLYHLKRRPHHSASSQRANLNWATKLAMLRSSSGHLKTGKQGVPPFPHIITS